MPLEDDLKAFNEKAAKEEEITKANTLINDSIQNAAGSVYGQKTQIQFNTLSYERIIECYCSPDLSQNSYISLSQCSGILR